MPGLLVRRSIPQVDEGGIRHPEKTASRLVGIPHSTLDVRHSMFIRVGYATHTTSVFSYSMFIRVGYATLRNPAYLAAGFTRGFP